MRRRFGREAFGGLMVRARAENTAPGLATRGEIIVGKRCADRKTAPLHPRMGRQRLDGDSIRSQDTVIKVAQKSLRKRRAMAPARATLTLSIETYRKIDRLRGSASRSAWVQQLIDQEEARLERERLVEMLREQYTPAVCRQTLAINEELPVHDR